MYKLSVRQILVVAMFSAFLAAGTMACLDRFGSRFQPSGAASNEETGQAVPGITDPSVATDERNNIEVYRAVSPGVVFITTTSVGREGGGVFGFGEPNERTGTGSGSLIDDQGHILTNDHVIAGAEGRGGNITVRFGGDRAFPARIVGRDVDTDLAVIQVVNVPRELLRVVQLGDSNQLAVGQKVLAIGNPFGLDRTLTTGVISGLQRPIRSRLNRLIDGAIQTDASINPGNSGGPLLDSQGRLIGVNSQILSPSGANAGVGFAIPVSIVRRVVPQLIQTGFVNRPRLGVNTRDVERLNAQGQLPVEDGVLIVEVDPTGSAAQAGLQGLQQTDNGEISFDIITAINGERIRNTDDLTRFLDRQEVGATVQVEIMRGNRRMTIPVRLMPAQRQPVRR